MAVCWFSGMHSAPSAQREAERVHPRHHHRRIQILFPDDEIDIETQSGSNSEATSQDDEGASLTKGDGAARCRSVKDKLLQRSLNETWSQEFGKIHFPKYILAAQDYQYDKNSKPPLEEKCDWELSPEERASLEPGLSPVCPWEWYEQEDASRYPRTLRFARCRCGECRGRNGVCELVWYQLRVLRHNGTCVDGELLYEPAVEPVPVGCTCSFRPRRDHRHRHRGRGHRDWPGRDEDIYP